MENIVTSDDILGKDAVDSEGDILGIVMKLHIDRHTKKMTGITIDQGFMKPDLFVGMEYVRSFGLDVVFLNTIPADKLKGLDVLAADGRQIGTVHTVMRDKNRISRIVVSSGRFSKTKLDIMPSEIEEIGKKVVLKKGWDPLPKMKSKD